MNETIFTNLAQARSVLAAWRHDYNHHRPHSSLGNLTQAEMAAKSALFPSDASLQPGAQPGENAGSAALFLVYGAFRYFAGGDLTDWADAGTRPWLNALTPVARTIGPVDVATLPHHGMFDAGSPATISALGASDWIVSVWHAAHPSVNTLEAAFSERLYSGPRRLWTTALHPAAELAMRRLTARLASQAGHVVCRVAAGGRAYRIIVTDSGDEQDRITRLGPMVAARGDE